MDNEIKENIYQVITVEKSSPPEGMLGDDWYRYVIQKGDSINSLMECKKTGSLKAVTEHAQAQAELINSRNGRKKK